MTVNCDTREATFACGYCGREIKYTISVVEVFRRLAIGCPRVPEERAWHIAGQLACIEQVMCDFERATLAHLLKHPEDCGKTVKVVLGPSVGKDIGCRSITTTIIESTSFPIDGQTSVPLQRLTMSLDVLMHKIVQVASAP